MTIIKLLITSILTIFARKIYKQHYMTIIHLHRNRSSLYKRDLYNGMNYLGKRDETFDVMKGIGIFLMVTGHTLGPDSPLNKFIYSFHMPLFFLVTGYFFKCTTIVNSIRSSYHRLIKPYIFICFIYVTIKIALQYYHSQKLHIDPDAIIFGMGPGWFLLALFWGRIIINCIINNFPNLYILVAFIVSTIPIVLHQAHPIIMPLAIMEGLSCVLFIAIGYFSKQNNILNKMQDHNKTYIFISLLLWLNTSINGKIEMSACTYKLWIIDYLGAMGGAFLCYYIAKHIIRNSLLLTQLLTIVSLYSLAIYSFHIIDFCIPIWHHLSSFISQEYQVGAILFGRLLLFYPIVVITYHIPFLYNLFIGMHTPKRFNYKLSNK